MRPYPTKLTTARFALTGIAILLAVINAVGALVWLTKIARNGYRSAFWVRLSTLVTIIYLALLLGRDVQPQLHLPWHFQENNESFAQLAAFANLFGYLASAIILHTQFKLAFDLYSTGDKYARRVAAGFFFLSLALNLACFIATQVWEHIKTSGDFPETSPASWAMDISEFLLSFVLFLTSVTTLISAARGGSGATGEHKSAFRLLLAANILNLMRQTWVVITNGLAEFPTLLSRPRPKYPPYFVLISVVFDLWIMTVVVTLLSIGVRVGLRGRDQVRARRPVPLEEYSGRREYWG